MSRYVMEIFIPEHEEWQPIGFDFKTKQQLENWLEGEDFSGKRRGTEYYEWRAGYVWKPYDSKYVHRFVWNSGSKKGQEVKL